MRIHLMTLIVLFAFIGSVFAQGLSPFSILLEEFFVDDSVEFSKQKDNSLIPAAFDNLEKDLHDKGIQFYRRMTKQNQAFLVLSPEGTSKFNQLAQEVFTKWRLVMGFNPNMPPSIAGAYAGLNGQKIRGLFQTRMLQGDNGISTMYHEFIHAYLTDLEYKGSAHAFSLYFFRNPDVPYEDAGYGVYFPTQELMTFLLQGNTHPTSQKKSIDMLLRLAEVIRQIKIESSETSGTVVSRLHPIKNMELICVEKEIGQYCIPNKELPSDKTSENEVRNYALEKLRNIVEIGQIIDSVMKPFTETLSIGGREISILKSSITEADRKMMLSELQTKIFDRIPEIRIAMNNYLSWTQSYWNRFVEAP